MTKPKAIVGCEESQKVCSALIRNGWDAVSVDLLPTSGNRPDKHYQGDVFDLLEKNTYQLGIFFPPCTHICGSGSRWHEAKRKSGVQQEAIKFVEALWAADIPYMALENPVGVLPRLSNLGKASQIVQPYWFVESDDDAYQKRTCLWLKGLPNLVPTNKIDIETVPHKQRHQIHLAAPKKDRATIRSKTPTGMANAMADQWTQALRHLF